LSSGIKVRQPGKRLDQTVVTAELFRRDSPRNNLLAQRVGILTANPARKGREGKGQTELEVAAPVHKPDDLFCLR
jgi:hypothetical protein